MSDGEIYTQHFSDTQDSNQAQTQSCFGVIASILTFLWSFMSCLPTQAFDFIQGIEFQKIQCFYENIWKMNLIWKVLLHPAVH